MVWQQLDALVQRSAAAVWRGDTPTVQAPELNQAGDKALVTFFGQAGRDIYFYQMTFARVAGIWRLRSAAATGQALRSVTPARRP